MEQKPFAAMEGAARKLRFGSFEVDLQEQELYNRGIRIALQHKPFRILELLLVNRGALVTRDELARHLWPNLHVSFDRGLNTAVNVLRRALGDSPTRCRYIETRSGLGYRFIAHVEEIPSPKANGRASNSIQSSPDFEAHQDCLKGRYFYSKMTEEDLFKSIAHYESALKSDPNCALAYTGLASTYTLLALLGSISTPVADARVREYATAALRIDEKLAEAHAALAGVKKWFEWDWAGAEREYLAALELKSEHAGVRSAYAAFLCCTGRLEEASREIRRAQQLDPLAIDIATEVAWSSYIGRDFQCAVEQCWKALTLETKHAPAQHTLGLAYEQLGMFEEAIVELGNAAVCSGGHPVAIASLAHAHASSGNLEEAYRHLRELEELSSHRRVSPYWMSILHAGLGAHDAAFEWLEKTFEQRDVWLVWLKMEPRFDPLRSDPRFHEALQRLGLN